LQGSDELSTIPAGQTTVTPEIQDELHAGTKLLHGDRRKSVRRRESMNVALGDILCGNFEQRLVEFLILLFFVSTGGAVMASS